MQPRRRFRAAEDSGRRRLRAGVRSFPGAFSKRKRYGAVGMLALDCAQESAEAPIGKIRVLAALQDKCAEAQRITLPAAGQDAVRVKTVALTASVASAEPAVQAVVFADAADFDQTADVNFVSVDLLRASDARAASRSAASGVRPSMSALYSPCSSRCAAARRSIREEIEPFIIPFS